MRQPLTFVLWFLLPLSASASSTLIDNLPFRFEANRGQAAPAVQFLARGPGYTLKLTPAGSDLSILDAEHHRAATLRTRLVGGSPGSRLEPQDRQRAETNYLLGSDSAQWLRNIPSWSRIKYAQVYKGIDLVFYGSGSRLEYDFNVAPGADPSAIVLEFSGADRIRIDASGDLLLETAAGQIRCQKPVVFQQHGAARQPVAGSFALKGHNRVAFDVGAYDRARELVIDPTLAYATYLGGSKNDAAAALAVDSTGAVYVCGFTASNDFPDTGGSYQSAFAGGVASNAISGDAFVAKIDPVKGEVVYNTYLGGRGDDFALAIAVDSAGDAVVAGYTTSPNFPLAGNPYSAKYGGAGGNLYKITGDAFLAKLNPTGSGLLYSTYFGGSKDDAAFALALDSTGAAYIAGNTVSTDFPVTPGVVQPKFAGAGGQVSVIHGLEFTPEPAVVTGDAFVAKFSPAGALVFSTYLGGNLDDIATALALDAAGNIYVAGATLSNNFPTTPGAFQRTYGGTSMKDQYFMVIGDAFVTKLDPTGKTMLYSTFLGGNRDDMALGLAVDATGAAFVTGFTSSVDFPTTAGVYARFYKGPPTLSPLLNFMAGDVFVSKLNSAGSQLLFSTLIGGTNDDGGTAIALDPAGNVWVAGFTNSGDFPTTPDALQKTFPGVAYVEPASYNNITVSPAPIGHPFLLKMTSDGSAVQYSSFLGGSGNDRSRTALALDPAGNAYLAGVTASTNFPITPNALQSKYGGAKSLADPKGDAWIAKISGLFASQTVTPPPVTPPPVVPPVTVTSIVNAASSAQGALAGGEVVAIAGSGMGPAMQVQGVPDPNTGLLATTLAGTNVQFGGVSAPLVSVSATQVTAIVPYEVAAQTSVPLQVSANGLIPASRVVSPLAVTIAPSAPGLFSADSSGAGQALASNADGSPNSDSNPANAEDVITLYGTGEGQTNPSGVDGLVAGAMPPQPVLPVSVTIGGVPAVVDAYGGTTGQPAGYFQVAVEVPDGLGAGDQPVVLTVGAASSQANLTVAVSGNPPSSSRSKRKPRPPAPAK